MALPEQIRKQAAEVKAYYEQSDAGQQPAGDAPTDAQTAANDTVQDQSFTDSPVLESATQPPVNEQNAGASNPDDDNSETYAQRWRSLQGSYNAAIRQKSALEQRVTQLEELLSTLSNQSQQASRTPAPAPQAPAPARVVTDKDVEEYGESIDVMKRVSTEVLHPFMDRIGQLESALQQMQATVVPQVTAVSQRQQVSAEQQFWTDLSTYVPNWQEINGNESFQNWLLEADPLTGNNRQAYLENAQQSLDAYRVSAFFRTWLESSGQAYVAQTPQSGPTTNELERQVAPGRTRGSAAPQGSQQRMYSTADIKKFYDDVRTGKYKGRDQDRARTERDIFSAQREGRITVNA